MTPELDRLIASINACCDARGDDDDNRQALIAEATEFTSDAQNDLSDHFTEQARIWTAAVRGSL